ncbi:CgeB family protein [Microvirga mediterraneensis]|uniref:Glycosyltransferase n=1 Tax=Microvirga mediterraneensis TaxID=2754695 RepID=A0A838BHN7_9HYPH|nr:glycosyltransferase [Microvirga mediterraneensis]MBA1154761.1 glycosyltransferase [Microvirga mediterraneensis]
MKIVIFGLTISSSWGNGHATLWRGLCRALAKRGHRIVFFEKDVPYYAENRDLIEVPDGNLILYEDWESIRARAEMELKDADFALVSSYCPDGITAGDLLLSAPRAIRAFYDLDTPITFSRLDTGGPISYIGSRGLGDFDLVLSYTGGRAIERLRTDLGAQRVAPLYGHVDPDVHRPVHTIRHYVSDLSYLGTYAADRQNALQRLFIDPAAFRPDRRFLIGGAQYPEDFPWQPNIHFVQHLPPPEHPAFFSSSRLTLNITRQAMAEMGWCPSGRLFEAAACGAPILSDWWVGLDSFFEPGKDILIAANTDDAVAALDLTDAELTRIARAGRERTLAEHTSDHRAKELENLIEGSTSLLCPAESSTAMMEA